MPPFGCSGNKGRVQHESWYTSLAVIDECVAGIEAKSPTARKIKLEYPTQIVCEKRPAPDFEIALQERKPGKSTLPGANEILGTAEAH